MITHDVDEAILLADRVLVMSNGPYARVAESVAVDIPRPRKRADIIHHPAYYNIRNHLVDFLTSRSRLLSEKPAASADTLNQKPVIVHPADEDLQTLRTQSNVAQSANATDSSNPSLTILTGTES
jgi:nitrate/nitrite transport system ATP-binding protein